eukprot:gb/GEZN01005878.1/.p1 GENE.gb/GEZN01005878.1/~~gb/GEZN01005878.1/.p1  ORF type:complete len:482 (-),score=58.94 gb/GEZN01005878.1/:222-1667(-)
MVTVGGVFGACAMLLLLPLQLFLGIVFWRRRDIQPIKARMPGLVVITDFFMFLWIMQLGLQRIAADGYPCLMNLWTGFVGLVVLFNTYLWRCWVLYFTFELTQERLKGIKRRESLFMKNRHLIANPFAFKFLGTLTCILILPCGILTATNEKIPQLKGDSCDRFWGDIVIMIYMMGYTTLFLYFTLKLRQVVEGFKIKQELTLTACIAIVVFPPWLAFNTVLEDINNQYFPVSTLCLVLGVAAQFTVSTVLPVIQSLKPMSMDLLDIDLQGNVSNLNGVLMSKAGVEALKIFLTREFSVENLLFYEEIEAYRKMKEADAAEMQLVGDAQRIYAKYIVPDAPFQVNLPQAIVKDLDGRLRNIFSQGPNVGSSLTPDMYEPGYDMPEVPTIFDRAQRNIFKLMQTDSFPRFQRSPEYKKLVVITNEQKKTAQILEDEGLVTSSRRGTPHSTPKMQVKGLSMAARAPPVPDLLPPSVPSSPSPS